MSSICRDALLLAGLLLLLSLSYWQPTGAEKTGVRPKNLSMQLPKIFDWDRYKTSFQKIYPTIRDELARKKLFIASALKTFLHNMAFRLGKMKYFLSINQFSDSTPEELKKMYSGFKPEKHTGSESESSVDMETLTVVDLERLEQMLARIVAEKQPGYRLLAQQLQITIDNHRSKRDVGLSEQMDVDDDDEDSSSGKAKKRSRQQMSKSNRRHDRRWRNSNMKIDEFRSPLGVEQPKESRKFVKRVPSTNPEHTPLELFSQAAKTDENEDGLPEQQLKLLEIIPNSVDYVKRQFTWLTDTFKRMTSEDDEDVGEDEEQEDFVDDGPEENSDERQENSPSKYYRFNSEDRNEDGLAILQQTEGKEKAKNRKKRKRSQNKQSAKRARLGYLSDVSDGSQTEDKVYLDYREDGCLTVPRDQHGCGCCYAFAIVALMEWWHCKQTGKLVPFSEQYVVDCGRHAGTLGCSGSNMASMERFMRDWGVELRVDYPFLHRESVCPYEKEDWHRAGYKRPVVLKYDEVERRALWPSVLKMSGPALAFIQVPHDFNAYGGLVHQGHNCKGGPGFHAMLLVGHGMEDGEEYWLFRNSHSHLWGEGGYFKLSKAAQNACFDGITEAEIDFLRPPLQPIEMTEKIGDETNIRILTPYEADQEGLIEY